MELRRILVGLARGKESDTAVRRTMQLARAANAQVTVVHGVGVEPLHRGASSAPRWAAHVAATEADARETCRGKLELLVEDPVYAETPLDEYLTIRAEKPAEAILSQAREQGADLIVLGSHRHRALFDFGGTARAVLARSPIPVWVQASDQEELRRVVVPIDLSESSPAVIAAARTFAKIYAMPILVLHVFVPPIFAYDAESGIAAGPTLVIDEVRDEERAALKKLVADTDWQGIEHEVELAEGDPSEWILKSVGADDLLVMGTHGRTGLARAVLGSCAYSVLKHREGATLVVPIADVPALEAHG